jgi:hypothetical protein
MSLNGVGEGVTELHRLVHSTDENPRYIQSQVTLWIAGVLIANHQHCSVISKVLDFVLFVKSLQKHSKRSDEGRNKYLGEFFEK